MKNLILLYCKYLFAGASVLLFLALLLTACSGNAASASSSLNIVGVVHSPDLFCEFKWSHGAGAFYHQSGANTPFMVKVLLRA